MSQAERPQPISDEDLATQLGEMNRQAVGYLTDEVSQDQDDNLDRYLGKPYGDEEEGTSNAISMDVAEVVDWALPDMLEPFLSGDKVVEFEPSKRGDEAFCEQATALANHCFYVENDGVTVLYDTIKTGMIQKVGVTKTWWEREKKEEEQTLTGLTQQGVAVLEQAEGVTLGEVTAMPVNFAGVPPEALAAFQDGQAYTVDLRREWEEGTCRIESVPPEEIKVSQRAKGRNLDYVAHEREVRRSELIEMGFDEAKVWGLPANKNSEAESRRDTRFSDEQRQEAGHRVNLSDWVTLAEEYPLIDIDGQGVPRRWQVFRVDKTILGKEKVDDHPFDFWSPDRIPHRLIGLALADKVKQTQYIKTHLTRQMLDNVYLANNPRFEVPEGAASPQTIEDLLTYRVGGLIRTRGQGGQVRPIEVPDRSATAMQAIIYMDGVREQQSGVVRNGMAVSSEVVDPKSATEARKEDRNEQARKRLMIRMIAETLLVPVFRKILRNIVKYQDAEKSIYLNNEFVEMDPRSWNADLRATVAVGLGYSNRDENMQAASIIGQAQQLAAQFGIVTPANVLETGRRLVEAVGWRFPEKYFTDPQSPEGQEFAKQQQEKPDPAMAKVQGQLQMMQQEQQMRMAAAERDIQLKMLEAEAKQAIEDRKADFDFRAKMTQIQKEYDLKIMQMEAEWRLQERQQAFERDLAIRQQQIDARNADKQIAYKAANDRAKVGSRVRFGGKIG